MARQLTPWEIARKKQQDDEQERLRQQKRKEFAEKWKSLPPEEQAGIIFDIMEDVGRARSSAARANLYHMRF